MDGVLLLNVLERTQVVDYDERQKSKCVLRNFALVSGWLRWVMNFVTK